MKIKGTNTIPDWEGCFEENPKIELFTSFFEEDGEHLREKMKSPFYAKTFEKTKELALRYYDYTPENDIERIIVNRNGVEFYNGAVLLSFVGFIEKDIELIKMGARYALSLASCRTWYVDEKELAAVIECFLDTQSKENRVLFMRRYWYADSFADIGRLLGITESNARLRLMRMRKQLKTYLIEQEVMA